MKVWVLLFIRDYGEGVDILGLFGDLGAAHKAAEREYEDHWPDSPYTAELRTAEWREEEEGYYVKSPGRGHYYVQSFDVEVVAGA